MVLCDFSSRLTVTFKSRIRSSVVTNRRCASLTETLATQSLLAFSCGSMGSSWGSMLLREKKPINHVTSRAGQPAGGWGCWAETEGGFGELSLPLSPVSAHLPAGTRKFCLSFRPAIGPWHLYWQIKNQLGSRTLALEPSLQQGIVKMGQGFGT